MGSNLKVVGVNEVIMIVWGVRGEVVMWGEVVTGVSRRGDAVTRMLGEMGGAVTMMWGVRSEEQRGELVKG